MTDASTNVSDDALATVVEAMRAETRRFLDLGYQMPPTYRDLAGAALAAAMPHLRDGIAGEIEATRTPERTKAPLPGWGRGVVLG